MMTDLWVQIFRVRSEKGYEKSYILVWNRVRVLRTVWHTPTQNFGEYPPLPRITTRHRTFGCSMTSVHLKLLKLCFNRFELPPTTVALTLLTSLWVLGSTKTNHLYLLYLVLPLLHFEANLILFMKDVTFIIFCLTLLVIGIPHESYTCIYIM